MQKMSSKQHKLHQKSIGLTQLSGDQFQFEQLPFVLGKRLASLYTGY